MILLYHTLLTTAVAAIDLASLGHVAVAGKFNGISITNQSGVFPVTHDALYSTNPYTLIGESDGTINAICAINNTVYIGGNFTKIGGVAANNIASYTTSFSPLSTGLLGNIAALYCDNDRVYIGGTFDSSNSSNTVVWSVPDQRFDTSFNGFNGPVNTIVAGPVYGGRFDSLANETSSTALSPQQINLQTAYITAQSSTGIQGFSNPYNIVCPSGQDAAGSTWLLADNQIGSWSAEFNYTFRPTKFRMYNTRVSGRATKEFRFVYQPTGGILNLTYIDPNGNRAYCDSVCPLGEDFTEYQFVNVIEMTGFSIDITAWNGVGAGLRGFEIFREDIYAYAVDAFNEPTCANGTYLSSSSTVGSWTAVDIAGSSGYLTATLSGLALSTDSVTLNPQISQRGTYSVRVYTPGCLADSTCNVRGAVMVTVESSPGVTTNTTIFQTNNYEKYDTVFQGMVQPSSSTFRPRVRIAPLSGQSGSVVIVASSVQFLQLSASTDTLNGLYPGTIDLGVDAIINVIVPGATTYYGGNFTGAGTNIYFSGINFGLNNVVQTMVLVGDLLYIGGNFTAGINATVSPYLTAYNTTSESLVAINGVNGPVKHLFVDNDTIGVSGDFTSVGFPVSGTAFLRNLQWADMVVTGNVQSSVKANQLYLIGKISAAAQTYAPGVAALYNDRVSARRLDTFDVYAGTFYNSSTKSLTVVGGNGLHLISNTSVTTLTNETILSTHVDGDLLYYGGSSLSIYNLESSTAPTQPAALTGANVQVNSITSRPGIAQIVVAGNFDSAGSLACPSLCILDRATTTWQRPATGLTGIINSSTWLGQNLLLLAGNMILNGTTHYIATFDFNTLSFSSLADLPGPARIAVSDTNQTDSIYIAGSSYLYKYNGSGTTDLGAPNGTIWDLQFVPASRSANNIMGENRELLLLGQFSASSGLLYDGASYTPFISTISNSSVGTIRTLFSDQAVQSFARKSGRLSRGVVIVIALAIAFFIVFTIVALGVLVSYLGRRREGYRPASTIEKGN